MKAKRTTGLMLFWIGAAYMFIASWLIMWWVAPLWRHTPTEQFNGTIWAFGGPVFMFISFSVPLGILLTAIGMLIYSESQKLSMWPFLVFLIGGILVALSMLMPATMGYYPVLFSVSGGFILIFFFTALWYWAKNRRKLSGPARIAADFQLVSYVFFLITSSTLCAMLGNPFSGLYFPERVLRLKALPVYYSMGTKVVIYLVLGFLFALLSQYQRYKASRSESE
jgi:hypothetical protein